MSELRFAVEEIRGRRGTGKHTEYRLKWAGYAEDDHEGTTWEPASGLERTEALEQYNEAHQAAGTAIFFGGQWGRGRGTHLCILRETVLQAIYAAGARAGTHREEAISMLPLPKAVHLQEPRRPAADPPGL